MSNIFWGCVGQKLKFAQAQNHTKLSLSKFIIQTVKWIDLKTGRTQWTIIQKPGLNGNENRTVTGFPPQLYFVAVLLKRGKNYLKMKRRKWN